jgi:hypothetical protein
MLTDPSQGRVSHAAWQILPTESNDDILQNPGNDVYERLAYPGTWMYRRIYSRRYGRKYSTKVYQTIQRFFTLTDDIQL